MTGTDITEKIDCHSDQWEKSRFDLSFEVNARARSLTTFEKTHARARSILDFMRQTKSVSI